MAPSNLQELLAGGADEQVSVNQRALVEKILARCVLTHPSYPSPTNAQAAHLVTL